MAKMALLGESLLNEKAFSTPEGVEIVSCGSGLGFKRGVVETVRRMQGTRPGFSIAVAARGRDREQAALALNLAGVPTNPGFSTPLSSTPAGRFLLGVCALPKWNWHNLLIQRLLSLGIVFGESPSEYMEQVCKKGARFGVEALSRLDMPFAERLLAFQRLLPDTALPGVYLHALERLVEIPKGIPLPGGLHDAVFSGMAWRLRSEVSLDGFRAMLQALLDNAEQEIFPADKSGVSVLSPEQLRGTRFDAVVVTGLEESVFPSRSTEDPRFPSALRHALEMTTGDTREQEEAFVLRQVFEAAGERLALIIRTSDEAGRSQRPSPLIDRLLASKETERTVISDSAMVLITPPATAPFLERALSAERERLFSNSFGPHDGIIGPGVATPPESVNASMLEAYARCPFRYMVERIWMLPEPSAAPVLSSPDRPANGIFVHKALELALSGMMAGEAVTRATEGRDLGAMLGSDAFAENYRETLVRTVERTLEFFLRGGYHPLESERSVSGIVAGLPGTGRLDLLAETADGLVALDLKTGDPKRYRKPLENMNLFQLPVYYALCSAKPVQMGYLHVRSDDVPVLTSVTKGEIEEVLPAFEERIREIFRCISSGIFPPSGDENVCGSCGCGHLCRISPRARLARKGIGGNAHSS